MNLSDLVNYVCTSTGYLESDDLEACRGFLLARDRMIYDSALWKDALVMSVIPLDPVTNPDHAAGFVYLPEVVNRIVGVRTPDNAVRVNGIELYFRFDMDKFQETGTPFEFAPINPGWFTIRPVSDPLTAGAAMDSTGSSANFPVTDTEGHLSAIPAIKFDTVAGKKYQVTADSHTVALVNSATDVASLNDAVALAPGQTLRFVAAGTKVLVQMDDGGSIAGFSGSVKPMALQPYKSSGAGATVTIASSDQSDVAPINVIWRDAAGKRYNQTAAMPLTLTPDDNAGYFDIEAIYKPATTGTLSVTLNDSAGLTLVEGTLNPACLASPSYERLRLFGIPSVSVSIRVLGKAQYQPLQFDQQQQTLRNSENCLIAFARGDLLRRGGENANAQLAYQEAAALLQSLKDLEAVQAANNVRIIPDQGFGPEWGIGPYIRPYW